MSKDKKIVIIGATSMVGAHLAGKLLQEEYANVYIVVRDARYKDKMLSIVSEYVSESKFNEINVIIDDITDIESLTNIFSDKPIVVNCAAEVSLSAAHRKRLILTNSMITYNIVEASLIAGIEKLIHISSIATLTSTDGEITTEEDRLESLVKASPYSASKFISENEVWRGIYQDLNAIILAPAVILGCGNWNGDGSSSIIKRLDRKFIPATNGVTGYVGVNDVVDVIIKLFDNEDLNNQKFILCSENISYKDIFTTISSELGHKTVKINIPYWLLSLMKRAIEIIEIFGINPKVSSYVISNLMSEDRYNGSKITSILNFTYTPINKVIKQCVCSYKKHYL